MEKILKISKIMKYSLNTIIIILIVAIILLLVIYAGITTTDKGDMLCFGTHLYSSEQLSDIAHYYVEIMHSAIPFQLLTDFWIKSILMFVIIYLGSISCFIYYHLKKLFSLYEQGLIFTIQNIKHIKYIAWGILISAFCRFIFTIGIWFTVNKHINIPLSINSAIPINYILIGVIAYSISLVMEEANKLKEENEMVI
ncbi:MAG: DUF2975 domain-containing protein [Candidatus Cloacimonetes bacterium]|nr:DUF2975 domain-containing protein [Candidatus Cloacimonadota bacterium]MDD4157217.1 DUF2975 domain-containing protein [Candidatus Cloacimonadota bacterium]